MKYAPAAATAAVVFVVAWLGIHHGWYTHRQLVDTGVYQKYGDAIARGEVPYRDFTLEYPPGALPMFVLPTGFAATQSAEDYRHSFEHEMLGFGVVLVLLAALALARLEPRVERALPSLALVALAPLLVGSMILTRFDLWPATLATAALAALLWGRESTAAILLAVAIAAKWWPATILPVAFAYEWRRHGRGYAFDWAFLFAIVLACCFVPFAILSPSGLWHSVDVQLSRPLQVESLGASVLMALHHAFGLRLHFDSSHGSQNLVGAEARLAAAATSVAEVVALLFVWIRFARGPARPRRIAVAAAASVTAFVAFGKVFSPQFLIWLVPLVAVAGGLAAPALLATALVLTQIWFPERYWPLALNAATPQSWLLLARDVCVVALTWLLARRLQHDVLGEDSALREPLEPVRREVQLRSS